jgi:hypothetical protein
MRTYNPALEKALEQWGVLALPKQYERERRFVNLVRQHDKLRALSDEEYERFIDYMDGSCNLVLDVMVKEKEANQARSAHAIVAAKTTTKTKAKTKRKPARKKASPRPRKRAPTD